MNISSDTSHINVLVHDCNNSIANALELLQSCTKPSTYSLLFVVSRTLWYSWQLSTHAGASLSSQ